MLEFDDVDPERDLPKDRFLGIDPDNDFVATRKDPYGYWYIHRQSGNIPESLKGAYTSLDFARTAAQTYFKSIQPVPSTRPEIKFKKVKEKEPASDPFRDN